MMKKIFLSLLMTLCCLAAQAQLGAPKITVRDTFYVVSAYYNSTELSAPDWPCYTIVDDVLNLSLAGFTYAKGKPVEVESYEYNSSWEGHIDYFEYKASCNGKVEDLVIVKPRPDCNSSNIKIVLGDYAFFVVDRLTFYDALHENFKREVRSSVSEVERERLSRMDEAGRKGFADSLLARMQIEKRPAELRPIIREAYSYTIDGFLASLRPAAVSVDEASSGTEEEVFVVADVMPSFPGGTEAMAAFVSQNLVYPSMARENNIEGRVYVSFVVEKDGSLSDIKVLRDIGAGCGAEAVRVVKRMPKWIPGMSHGTAVRCQCTLPLTFHLE